MFRNLSFRVRAVGLLTAFSAATWGMLGGLMALISVLISGGLRHQPGPWLAHPWAYLGYGIFNWSILGAIAGGVAGVLLPSVLGNRRVDRVPIGRFVILGAVSGFASVLVALPLRGAASGGLRTPAGIGLALATCAIFGAATGLAALLVATLGGRHRNTVAHASHEMLADIPAPIVDRSRVAIKSRRFDHLTKDAPADRRR